MDSQKPRNEGTHRIDHLKLSQGTYPVGPHVEQKDLLKIQEATSTLEACKRRQVRIDAGNAFAGIV